MDIWQPRPCLVHMVYEWPLNEKSHKSDFEFSGSQIDLKLGQKCVFPASTVLGKIDGGLQNKKSIR